MFTQFNRKITSNACPRIRNIQERWVRISVPVKKLIVVALMYVQIVIIIEEGKPMYTHIPLSPASISRKTGHIVMLNEF